MHKLLVIYGKPDDPAHFRRHYREIHVPLAKGVPGVRAMRYSLNVESPESEDGEAGELEHEFDAFCVFEAEWDDLPAMVAALASPEGQAVVEDVANYATGGYVRMHYEV